jgi:hypothetical protein
VTHHEIKVLDDGTRVYSNYSRYTPMPDDQRTNRVRRPDDPRAVRFHGQWFIPLDLAPDEQRVTPETRPDDEAYDHMHTTALCRCRVCTRPQAERWRRKWRKDHT